MRTSRPTIRMAIAAIALFAPVALAACALPADMPADVKQVMSDKCWGCHASTKAANWKSSTRSGAEAMIDRMVAHGASISKREREILISYFLR